MRGVVTFDSPDGTEYARRCAGELPVMAVAEGGVRETVMGGPAQLQVVDEDRKKWCVPTRTSGF